MTSKLLPIILSLASIAFAACDPCDPIVSADTLVIPVDAACVPDGGTTATGGGDSSDGTTIAECLPPEFAPTCASIPKVGGAWGACLGGKCNDGSACMVTPLGDICLPACDGEGCTCKAWDCWGGACEHGSCRPACEAIGDPCPVPGMVCDLNDGDPLCVYQAQ